MALKNDDFQQMYEWEMREFLRALKTSDLAGIHVPAEANPVKGEKTKVGGSKGGKPPVDYTAVELKADAEAEMAAGRWRSAYHMYCTLKRLTNA